MKAAIVHSFDQPLSLEDVPIPTAGPEQVLVRIEACGLCHTDIHAARGEWPVKPDTAVHPRPRGRRDHRARRPRQLARPAAGHARRAALARLCLR